MFNRRVAEKDFGESGIGGAELSENREDAGGFVGDALNACDASIGADLVAKGYLGTCLELLIEPGRHALFEGVRAELGFLGLKLA